MYSKRAGGKRATIDPRIVGGGNNCKFRKIPSSLAFASDRYAQNQISRGGAVLRHHEKKKRKLNAVWRKGRRAPLGQIQIHNTKFCEGAEEAGAVISLWGPAVAVR